MRLLPTLPSGFPRSLALAALAAVPLVALGLTLDQTKTSPARQSASLPSAQVRWTDLAKAEEPSYRRHVVPLMSRAGCSGRECHGSFSGQGGFQLSLFGYDFDKDHKEITADAEDGPRVELQDPKDSLILVKATNEEKHKGKERIKKGSWEYNLLLKWVQAGAKNDTIETGEFDRLEIEPKEVVFSKPGESTQLRVLAHWKDGTVEDVTQLTRFRTNDESVATITDVGRVEIKGPGDTHIVAFYDNGVQPVPTMLPVSDKTGAKYPTVKTRTKVDELVVGKLRGLGIVPADLATDAEFLRRVRLDLTATLPTPEEIRTFLADKSPDKRRKKIDQLLATPEYAAWWTTLLCDYTGNNARQLNQGGVANYAQEYSRQWYDWIFARIARNEPYDKLAAGIVLATTRSRPDQTYTELTTEWSGYLRKENPTNFAERETMPHFWARQNVQKPEERALAFAHTFLGVRIECAQCHKHPFDQWTQTDFKQFQAFFEPVAQGARNNTADPVNYNTVSRELRDMFAKYEKDKGNNFQKLQQDEVRRRVNAGEVFPMREVYIRQDGMKNDGGRKNKDQNFSGRVITPKILGGDEVHLTEYSDPRQPLMQWLRAQENPYFAASFVNRVWATYFGRGIVEPADDMNLANPPSNRRLIDHLAAGFVKSGYDVKWLHREILNSDTYQRSWKTNETNRLDEKNFSHAVIRRLPAEVVYDGLRMATTATDRIAKFQSALDERAIGAGGNTVYNGGGGKLGDTYALNIFGKPARTSNCDCERTTDPTLLQTIFTRNDPSMLRNFEGGGGWVEELRKAAGGGTDDKIQNARSSIRYAQEELARLTAPAKPVDGDGEALALWSTETERYEQRVTKLKTRIAESEARLAEASKPRAVFEIDSSIQEVFLRTVSRPPTAAEVEQSRADIAAAKSPVEGVRDLLWVMLNTREFMVNH